jgi:CRISPR-associated protein Cmr2
MGAIIDACRAFAEHRALSAALEGFASQARRTVVEHEGSLVYSGGDDVLALLPVHRLTSCVERLATDFSAALSHWKSSVDGVERRATLSVGVALVHQLVPLGDSLELVRRAEKMAKNVQGKNGLAIIVKRRGGEAVEVSGSLGRDSLLERLSYLALLHRQDRVPAKAQYELMQLAQRTTGVANDALEVTLQKVVEAEARRILGRKQSRHGRDERLEEEVLNGLAARGAFQDPVRLGRELYVAAEIARAEQQAFGSPAALGQAPRGGRS